MRRYISIEVAKGTTMYSVIKIVEQPFRNDSFVCIDCIERGKRKVTQCLRDAYIANVYFNQLTLSFKTKGAVVCAWRIVSVGSPMLGSSEFFVRGTDHSTDSLSVRASEHYLGCVIKLVCAYNQYHNNNRMSVEDHMRHIQADVNDAPSPLVLHPYVEALVQ